MVNNHLLLVSLTILTIPYATVTVGTAQAFTQAQLPAWNFPNSGAGGMYGSPITVPTDLDRSRPIYLQVALMKTPGVGPIVDTAVEMICIVDVVAPDATVQEFVIQESVTIPASWPANAFLIYKVNGGDPVFAGNTIQPNSLLGHRFFRDGFAPADTYTLAIGVCPTVNLLYNRLCSYGDCP